MIVNFEDKNVKLPDFFIIGAPRSGTTSLYYYLKSHPQVYFPSKKEPKFFAYYGIQKLPQNMFILNTLKDYLALFQEAEDSQLIGEASTNYLFEYKKVIPNLKKFYGDKALKLKFIAILRNPIVRAYSQYMLFKSYGQEKLSFEEAIKKETVAQRLSQNYSPYFDYIGFGLYYQQVKAYFDAFGKENVKVLIFEKCVKDYISTFKEICNFLGIDDDFVPSNVGSSYNVGGGYKTIFHKKLWEFLRSSFIKKCTKLFFPGEKKVFIEDRIRRFFFKNISEEALNKNLKEKLLKEIYINDILKLEKLLNMDLSCWIT